MSRKIEPAHTQFAIIGLGRFGMAILQALSRYDVNILACDTDPDCLHEAAQYATHVVQADAADDEALEKLGLGNFDVVILAMGADFEGSLLATMKAKELNVPYIVAKANGERQKKILESIGANLVVLPEHEMGAKIARRLVQPNILDVLNDTDRYSIAEMRPMAEWVGKTVRSADIRRRQGMTLLAILRGKDTIIPVLPDVVIEADDVLVTLSKPE